MDMRKWFITYRVVAKNHEEFNEFGPQALTISGRPNGDWILNNAIEMIEKHTVNRKTDCYLYAIRTLFRQ